MSNNQIYKKRKIPIIKPSSFTYKDSNYLKINKKVKQKRNNSYVKQNSKINVNKKKKFDFYLSFSKIYLNLKYKTTENTLGNFIITSLIKKKRGSHNLNFKELNILNDENEYFKRFYNINDSYFRIPKYYEYYKNYLLYFCKPFIRGKGVNKILLKHMEKAAEEFYKNNFDEEKKNENIEKNNNKRIKIKTIQPKIFSNNVIEEIENERLETNKISNIENEENKFLKRVKSVDGLIIKDNEDISSFFGISKITYQISSYDDSILKNTKINNLSFISLLSIFDKIKEKKNIKNKKNIDKKKEKKFEHNNLNITTNNTNNNSKKNNKREIRNNISNLNLKYFSDFLSPKNKLKDSNNNILEKLKESLHFKTKKNISPNKLVLNALNDFFSPYNIKNRKENKKYNLKNSNSTKNLSSLNSSNKQLTKLTISTNFNPIFHHIIKRPRRGVIFKNNNNNNNHQSTNTSSIFIKSPMHIYSTQSRSIRSNSNFIRRKNRKTNSLGNSKNGSQVSSSRKIISKHYDEENINNKKGSFNLSKKTNEDSTRTGNSRNNSHRKIPMMNSKVQSSLDFLKYNKNKAKNYNIKNNKIVNKTPINIKNNK